MTEDLGTLLARGRAAVRKNDHRSALAIFQRALSRDSDSVEALIGVALAATRLDLGYAATNAYLELTEIGIRTNNMNLAAKAVRRVLARAPENKLALRFDAFIRSRVAETKELGNAAPRFGLGTGDDWATVLDKSDADVAAGADDVAAVEPRPSSPFDDLTTRQGETAFVAALRKRSIGELFAATPTKAASRKLLARLVDECTDPMTAVAQMQKLAGTSLEEMTDWDAATTVAVASTNLRIESPPRSESPTRSESQTLEQWNESDFPSFAENDFEAAPLTISLGGPGVILTYARLTRESQLLRALTPPLSQPLLARSTVMQMFAGQMITRQGDAQPGLFLVLTGKVLLERENGGGAHHIASLTAGDFFGEDTILGPEASTINARVTADTLLLEISDDVIRGLSSECPEVLAVLSEQLRTRLLAILCCDRPELATLGAESRDELLEGMEVHKASAGGVITGGHDRSVWFLISGTVERWDVNHSEAVQAPAAFGGPQASDEIIASTSCWLVRIPEDRTRELGRLYPRLFARLGVRL